MPWPRPCRRASARVDTADPPASTRPDPRRPLAGRACWTAPRSPPPPSSWPPRPTPRPAWPTASTPSWPSALRSIPYASSVVVKRRLSPRGQVAPPPGRLRRRRPGRRGPVDLLAASFTSGQVPRCRAPAGAVLIRAFVGGATQPRPRRAGRPDSLEALVLRELAELLGAIGRPPPHGHRPPPPGDAAIHASATWTGSPRSAARQARHAAAGCSPAMRTGASASPTASAPARPPPSPVGRALRPRRDRRRVI